MSKIIKVSTDLEVTVHDYPQGNMREQNRALYELIGNGCDMIEHVMPVRLYNELGHSNHVKRSNSKCVSMLIDEEGLLKDNETNLIGSYLYGVDQHGQRIVGNVLFVTDVYEGDGISFTGIEPETFEKLHLFSMKMHWLPSFGFTWPWVDLGKSIQQTIMPLLCLAIGGVASICRQTRSSMLEVIGQDYIRTARSKGLKPDKIITVHALKNALIPVITLMGLRLGGMIGGSMFVESVFNISGMGTLLVSAIRAQDIPLIQACVLLIAVVACVVNIITDIVYAAVDPRIKV